MGRFLTGGKGGGTEGTNLSMFVNFSLCREPFRQAAGGRNLCPRFDEACDKALDKVEMGRGLLRANFEKGAGPDIKIAIRVGLVRAIY